MGIIDQWKKSCVNKPNITDEFSHIFGRDQPEARIFACYWTSKSKAEQGLAELNVSGMFEGLTHAEKQFTGVWLEFFVPDLTRFETNYSGDDYRPGLAQLPDTKQVSHNLTGYWGAARDRMRASAYDHFEDPHSVSSGFTGSNRDEDRSNSSPAPAPISESESSRSQSSSGNSLNPDFNKSTLHKHLRGTNTRTIAHIRSGQFWEHCPIAEQEAYENKLEPHLVAGLRDILEHPVEKGDFGLRFLRNIPYRKETCALGFFRSLADLEKWAKDCSSHHKIFGGALSHRNRFGGGYKMRTWHEICVLKPREARWEYINCDPGTGMLPFVKCDVVGDI